MLALADTIQVAGWALLAAMAAGILITSMLVAVTAVYEVREWRRVRADRRIRDEYRHLLYVERQARMNGQPHTTAVERKWAA